MDGIWREPSRPTQALCYDTRVLSEAQFRRRFGDVPPLPSIAFGGDGTNGWKSALV